MASTQSTAPRLVVKNIKTFNGHDGVGLNATLYFDGKKVCEIFDGATGGEWELHWIGNTFEERAALETAVNEYVATLPTKFTALNISADHLKEYGSEMTTVECPKGGHTVRKVTDSRFSGDFWCPTCNELCEYLGNTLRSFVDLVVEENALDKVFKRKCKTKTLIRRKGCKAGEYFEFNVAYTPALKDKIMLKYPDTIEIINERYFRG